MKNNVVVYDCVGAYYAGIQVDPVTQMRKLGYNIISSTGSAMFNLFRFEVEKIIEPLPPYLGKGENKKVKINPDFVFKEFEIKEGRY